MLWAAFTLAFFGFLSSAEFCSPATSRFSALHTLLRSDITIYSLHLNVHAKVSKADPFRNSSNLIIHATGSSICPVRAMTKHLDTTTHNDKPLFIFCNASYLMPNLLTSILRAPLGNASTDKSRYSSHSFRIATATMAAAADVPGWLIKVMGRWANGAYQVYNKTGRESLRAVTQKMAATSVPQGTQPWAVE